MKEYFAYTRVSTVKQGDGVSLEAQHDAIDEYAKRHNLRISEWFEEKETAAKRGRPVFSGMLKALRAGKAVGLIIHKIDRSARNPYDWAAISELLDDGIDVRFVHESLDLTSRGGRITADIQAVIAADYVRNLREECLKGIEGRLKQGLFPFGAPIGYLDQGAGKPKTPDPERAPYVRQAFELYATQQYSIRALLAELNQRGFRNRKGGKITKGCLENLLKNPFYHGVIYMQRTGRRYQGVHTPIIDKALFERVQAIKTGKHHQKVTLHNHTYRRLVRCGHCGCFLYGERQKGRVYMRCQTTGCPTTTIREDRLDGAISEQLLRLQLAPSDEQRLEAEMKTWLEKRTKASDQRALTLQLSNLDRRLEQLTDALLDGLIDKPVFLARKDKLDDDRAQLTAALTQLGEIDDDKRLARNFLELAKSLCLLYQMADTPNKRRLTEIFFSNRTLTGQNLYLEPQKWLRDKAWTISVLCSPPDQTTARTKAELTDVVTRLKADEIPGSDGSRGEKGVS